MKSGDGRLDRTRTANIEFMLAISQAVHMSGPGGQLALERGTQAPQINTEGDPVGPVQIASVIIAEASGNSFILLGVLVIMVFAIAYGLYSRQGSGINQHPVADSQDPVLGDQTKNKGKDEKENELATGIDQTEGSAMDQRGTQ